MIAQETISRIFQTAQIEEVVGGFVSLKKRGINWIANCPFHNEKTPSFYVSPAKGIYKCFGCGVGGNSVNFIMAHEKMTYPEALKFLASKYQIPIDEIEENKESHEVKDERESLMKVTEFAASYFENFLFNEEEGQTIGLSYFKERGFNENTIRKFRLGFSSEKWDAFTSHALKNQYQLQFLTGTGLTIDHDGKTYDRFRGRVIFPIYNISGRVIGFGGRALKSAEKAKYINSPESIIYHKSDVLYGIHLAKNTIIKNDNCFLVEGYTDVLSLHQAGVENTVASSGTSLTHGQIRLIRRFTKNVTILYDGDEAGINASLRGINLLLDEGMNVKIVLIPGGEDPDSFIKKEGAEMFKVFIQDNAEDFIKFKTFLFKNKSLNDPVKLSEAISDIVESISFITDPITRAIYIKNTSAILNIGEEVLIKKLNFFLKGKNYKKDTHLLVTKESEVKVVDTDHTIAINDNINERYIIQLLLNYFDEDVAIKSNAGNESPESTLSMNIVKFIAMELSNNSIEFEIPVYARIYKEITELAENETMDQHHFTCHPDPEISKLTADLLYIKYEVSSNWKAKYDIFVPLEKNNLNSNVVSAINLLKLSKLKKMLAEVKERLKTATLEEEYKPLLEMQNELNLWKQQLSIAMRAVVI